MKKIAMGLVFLSLVTNVFAGGLDGDLSNEDYIDNEVKTTIKDIDEAINNNKDLTTYVYYFSKTCGACQKVNKFFTDNKIEERFDLIKRDTADYDATQELIKVRQSIGLDPMNITVPFLVYKESGEYKYLGGSDSIIEFFKGKLKEFYPETEDNKEEGSLGNDVTNPGNDNNSGEVNGEEIDKDKENQDLLLYFILAGLVLLLGGGSFIILKKK